MAAIEISGLQKTYSVGFLRKREVRALRPLTLTVEAGEVFGYLGANGAGKTTTLKLLMGIIFPSGGSARILGLDYRDPRVRAQIGFLPEQPYFYDHLTATELLEYYAQLSGVPAAERKRRVPRMLERVGLPGVGGLPLRRFSKGMMQRVGIAQAVLHDPKVVFLDEPMSGLDPIGRREVRDLMQSLKDEGKTIFFSTHILSDAEALCDRVAVLHQGELRCVEKVGALATAKSDQMEVLWQGDAALAQNFAALGAECRITGDEVRAVVPEAKLNAALDLLRNHRARLISVVPVRTTLEDYFLEHLAGSPSGSPDGSKDGRP